LPGTLSTSNLAALKLQLYAYNDTVDASSQYQSIFIEGSAIQNIQDTIGPSIKTYINTPFFKSGDWVSSPANLFVVLKDSAGILSSGNELGHDLKLILDDSIAISYNLNAFFTYDLNQFQSGVISYPLPILKEGKHRLIIKAWDLLGNASKDTILIEVPSIKNNNIRNLSITPNPVQTNAKVSFEVKNIQDPLTVYLDVYDARGRVYFSIKQTVQPIANKIVIDWNGLSSNGGLIPPGMYYYKVQIQQGGLQAQLINTLLKL
jgi:hypothetical protein